MRCRRVAILLAAGAAVAAVAGGCGAGASSGSPKIVAVGAENEYADVMSQIGGRYAQVTAIMSNPNTDPHAFEASASVARTVSAAQLIVQNGAGYDTFMNQIESASPSSSRTVIDVQTLLGLPDSTLNPHLWYDPGTMPKVAQAVGDALARIDPGDALYYRANVTSFDSSLAPWTQAIQSLKAEFPGTPVATTEPVADYLLAALGFTNLSPWAFQADIMNGTDPSAQDVSNERALITGHRAKVFLYNQQVTDSLTQSILDLATSNGIPVVGVYETMPAPGYRYQSWMLAEVNAIRAALTGGTSTTHL
jgi:zinc/manganese transport system substrate-binding protein